MVKPTGTYKICSVVKFLFTQEKKESVEDTE